MYISLYTMKIDIFASIDWWDRYSLSYPTIHKIGGILSHLSYEVVKYSKDIHRAFPLSYPVDRTGNNISLSSFIYVKKKFSGFLHLFIAIV